jgi:hypothetical protein
MTDDVRAAKLEKIRKLFAQAADVAGTPEADVFNARAFDLLARYGIDEAEARRSTDTGPAEVRLVELTPNGAYLTQQIDLLTMLARSLHCYPLVDVRQQPKRVLVWGIEQHTARVQLLWSMLMPQMLAGAARMRPEPGSYTGVKVYRTSWMRGYIHEIGRRLTNAEQQAAEQSTAPGMALELVTDASRAKQEGKDFIAGLTGVTLSTTRTRGQHSRDAAERGRAAGARANLGQTGLGSRRALGR